MNFPVGLNALALLLVFAVSAAAHAAQSQSIGMLFSDTPAERAAFVVAFREALAVHGYGDAVLDARYASGDAELLAAHAKALAGANHAIVIAAGTSAAMAAHRTRPAAPLLVVGVGDPVRMGLVASLERPGGNVTGSTDQAPDTARRRLELVREVLPGARRVALIANGQVTPRAPADAAAAALGLELVHVDVRVPADFAAAYSALSGNPPDALIVTPNPVTFAERGRLAAFGLERRIPVIFGWREFMDVPGLVGYGANLTDLYVTAARQATEILRGRSPAEMPVERPRFDLVVNVAVARKLGLTLPQAVVRRADAVIE